MHTFDIKKVFYTYLPVEKDVKSPCSEEITACVKEKSANKVNRIDILECGEDILQINLSKE